MAQAGSFAAASVPFPPLRVANLNGATANFPAELPGARTLVLVAFYRKQQKSLDVWIKELGLKEPEAPAWIEMPVVRDLGALWQTWVDSGMRSGITGAADRARVYTVYGNRDHFCEKLRLPGKNQIYLLAVEKSGTIVLRIDGDYTPEKAVRLRAVMMTGPQ
jgi:hypothetical protein